MSEARRWGWRVALAFVVFDFTLRGAVACGMTPWSDWPPGDAHDLAFVAAVLVLALIWPRTSSASDEERGR